MRTAFNCGKYTRAQSNFTRLKWICCNHTWGRIGNILYGVFSWVEKYTRGIYGNKAGRRGMSDLIAHENWTGNVTPTTELLTTPLSLSCWASLEADDCHSLKRSCSYFDRFSGFFSKKTPIASNELCYGAQTPCKDSSCPKSERVSANAKCAWKIE